MSSQVIVGIGLYIFCIAIDFRKTSLKCLSYMGCKISRHFRDLFIVGTKLKCYLNRHHSLTNLSSVSLMFWHILRVMSGLVCSFHKVECIGVVSSRTIPKIVLALEQLLVTKLCMEEFESYKYPSKPKLYIIPLTSLIIVQKCP